MIFKTRQGDQNESLIIKDLDRLARLVLLNKKDPIWVIGVLDFELGFWDFWLTIF